MTDTFVVNGKRLAGLLNGPDAKVKYLRLFSVPDNPRAIDTLVEFMAAVSDWTERQLGELHPDALFEMFADTRMEVEKVAVDPTTEKGFETGDSEPKTKSPDGASS